MEQAIKSIDELEFAVFCIENTAAKLGIKGEEMYRIFMDNDILYGYIVPEYEMLHTQGKEYIVNDIIELIREKGIEV